jgi:hypothetical protein
MFDIVLQAVYLSSGMSAVFSLSAMKKFQYATLMTREISMLDILRLLFHLS